MEYINTLSFKQKLKNYKKHPFSFLAYLLVVLAAAITVFILFFSLLLLLQSKAPKAKAFVPPLLPFAKIVELL